MVRVIVKLNINDTLIIPKFPQCLVSLLQEEGKNDVGVNINMKLFHDHLLISKHNEDSSGQGKEKYLLQHSIECPMKMMSPSLISSEDWTINIPVAVSLIVESADHHILWTKRSSTMKSAPGIWVPPGGHLESGESLISCGLRELCEETGLRFKEKDTPHEMLCIWENVFPIILGFGNPKRHGLVVYYRIRCRQTHKQLTKVMKINPREVAAFTWLSPLVIQEIFSATSADKPTYTQNQFVYDNGRIRENMLEYLKTFPRVTWSSSDIYSGVQCALTHWYQCYSREGHIDKGPTSKM